MIAASLRGICVLSALLLAPVAANAAPQILSEESWREDIAEAAEAIKTTHPRPYLHTTEEEFDQKLETLLSDVPNLSDKEIIVRLAALVALVKDGHTRLSIPRQHPEIGLEFGHTGTPAPNHDSLAFKQLPVAVEVFDDGIFITAASPAYAELIGSRLDAIDGKSAAEALDAVQTITFAENSQLEKLMGADRLSLPEALAALGVIDNSDNVTLKLTDRNGETRRVVVEPLPPGEIEWADAFAGKPAPLRRQNPEQLLWIRYLPKGNIVYAQINQIADADVSFAAFAADAVERAEAKNAKLVLDIRMNFGGSGDLNRSLVLALIQSKELNQYGRLFVLTGRRTFSAAQFLTNDLEQYTRALFVGEPTGARPDSYGDPRKIRLKHSGLTLRVSALHWSSYLAHDRREATVPDIPAPWTSTAYFGGEDPAIAAAAEKRAYDLKSVLRRAFLNGNAQKVERYLIDSVRSPDTHDRNLSKILLELGLEFKAKGAMELAGFAFDLGLYLYPDNDALKAAANALQAN